MCFTWGITYNINENKLNKLLPIFLIVISFIANSGCTEKPRNVELAPTQENKKLPQSKFEGIPFPGNQQQAKTTGFTDCHTEGGMGGYKCFLDRQVKFEGYEFYSAYILLNTDNNLVYPDTPYNLQEPNSYAIQNTPPQEKYSYHSIHLWTNPTIDASCVEKNAGMGGFASSGCSSGEVFLHQLENKGWVKRCDEGSNTYSRCSYYTKDGSYRISTSGMVQTYVSDLKGTFVQLHLEIDPLSPYRYGVDYKEILDQQELKNQEKKVDEDFIKSMKI